MQQLPLGMRLRDRAVFESYLAGPNAQARAHLEATAAGLRGVTWVYGPVGSGKTHLLQAVCARAGESGRAGYFPLRENARLGSAALEGWQLLDCLCLDDIGTVVGQRDWETAIFTLHRETQEQGHRLVVAADAPPARLAWALADLGSRFSAGAIVELHALDEVQQAEALRRHARARGLELPEETIRYLQRRFPRDMHSLCGLLDQLDDAALAAQRRVTVPFIRTVLGEEPQGAT